MSITRRMTTGTFLFFSFAPTVNADLIGTYQIYWKAGGLGIFEWITHETYLSDEFNAPEGMGTLFEGIIINDGETRVDTVTKLDDPDFGAYADLLTDGLDWWLYDWAYLNAGGAMGAFHLESVRLDFADPDHPGPDLFGYEIKSVTRTITVEFDSPGSDPNGDGNWTDYEISGVFEIYGYPVPEPAMVFPLLLMVTIIRRRRRA